MNTEENKINELTEQLIGQDFEIELLKRIVKNYADLTNILYSNIQNIATAKKT
jgi:hypothetical protein